MNEMVELTAEQRAIVEAKENKIVVIATAAAGKTRCITERIRYLLQQGVPASEIAAITFTNAAAEEMSARLGAPTGLFIGTIHSLANRMLLSHGIDTSRLINNEKFDELFELVEKHPECVKRFKHLVLDEAQDSSPSQFSFVIDMIQPENYILVGDHRQSIYTFADADPTLLTSLAAQPDVKVYELTQNYRNAPEILEYAKSLIQPLGAIYRDRAKAMRQAIGRVLTVEYSGDGIAKTIARRVSEGQDKYNDWFILTRTNAQAAQISATLNKYNIPNCTFKKANFDNKGLQEKMKENNVKVLTIHTSKGLEAKNVVVIGAHFRGVEETCLCYVAATRAKDLLVWTFTKKYRKPRPTTTRWE